MERSHTGVRTLANKPRSDRTIEALFRDSYEDFCRLALLMTGSRSEAEDIVMDAFSQIVRRARTEESQEYTRAYVRVAVVSVVYRATRRKGRRKLLLERIAHADAPVSSDTPLPPDSRLIGRAIRSLPVRQRMAVVLRYYEGLSESEMSDVMKCSVGTIKSHLSRAKKALAPKLITQLDVE